VRVCLRLVDPSLALGLRQADDRAVEAPLTIYEIAQIVGSAYESSAEPLTNPWKGHMDVTLARSLGFQPKVPTVYQAIREGKL